MSAEPRQEHPLLRPLAWADLDRVMQIELAAYPYPWSRGIFSDCLRVGYDCWALQDGGRVVGYSVQTTAAGESHLLNLCVDPARQRRGFGQVLLENAIRVARARGCESMYLEVRPSNRAAIALYLARGFSEIGRRPDYYSADDGKEDALVLRLGLAF